MLLIRTTLAPSPIHGTGVFAAQDIAAGTKIWEFTEGVDEEIPGQTIRKLPTIAREFLLKHAYRKLGSDLYVHCADDTRYFNHSEHPTVVSMDVDGPDVAARDIAAGEELTIDYRTFDADTSLKLGER